MPCLLPCVRSLPSFSSGSSSTALVLLQIAAAHRAMLSRRASPISMLGLLALIAGWPRSSSNMLSCWKSCGPCMRSGPACPSRASGWSSLTTPWGFPCCVRFPCVHAAATTPVQRMGILVAQNHPPMSAFPETTTGSACTLSFSRSYDGAGAAGSINSGSRNQGMEKRRAEHSVITYRRHSLQYHSGARIGNEQQELGAGGTCAGYRSGQGQAGDRAERDALEAAIEGYRRRAAAGGQTVERVILVYEAGYGGFWLARWLKAHGIEVH